MDPTSGKETPDGTDIEWAYERTLNVLPLAAVYAYGLAQPTLKGCRVRVTVLATGETTLPASATSTRSGSDRKNRVVAVIYLPDTDILLVTNNASHYDLLGVAVENWAVNGR